MQTRQKCGSRAHKGALASTLLNAKMRNGTPHGLMELTDSHAAVIVSL